MEKQKYYVNLNPISMDDISPVKIEDSDLIQYEVECTPDELQDLQKLLSETQSHDFDTKNLMPNRSLNEKIPESDRKEFQHDLDKVFEVIYQYGSPITRQQIEEIHLVNDEPKRNMRHGTKTQFQQK
ncbi:hypothetical protein ACFPU1_10775 [Thalassorhabdus alkalitolerans]|uniref:Uncharacterized protein n=1 Tax=Thalassorhabdus alkalitolerans TaxID=2282697 RepID=A0ABW0YND6_9BACI